MGFLDEQLGPLRALAADERGWPVLAQLQPDAIDRFQLVLDRYAALGSEPIDEVAPNARQEAFQQLTRLRQVMEGVVDLSFEKEGVHREAEGIAGTIREAWRWWTDQGRLHVRGRDVDLARLGSEAEADAGRIREALREAEGVRDALRDLATVTGTLHLAKHYSDKVGERRRAASWALRAVAALTIVLVVGGWALFHTIGDTDQWTVFAREALAKAFAVGAVSYGIAFSARAYRTNTHLAAVYEQKATALETFGLLDKTVSNEDARVLILGELVRSVFSIGDTGVGNGGEEHTVIETAVPLATAMSRLRG